MGRPANIDWLVGRSYVTKSGGRCVFQKLGNGALRVDWKTPTRETQADRDEVNAWVVSMVEAKKSCVIDATVCEDQTQEAAMYAKWKKELKGE